MAIVVELSYQVRETAGTHAATLVNQHFVLSNGFVADATFNPTPKVAAHATTSGQSTLTVLTTTVGD
jgi:hypothetical protein